MTINHFRAAILLLGMQTCGVLATCQFGEAANPETPPLHQDKNAAVDERVIRDLLQKLGDDSFEIREAANKRLADIGEPALELLLEAAEKSTDVETRFRAQELARGISSKLFTLLRQFKGHETEPAKKATCVVVTPDGLLAVSAGSGKLRTWNLKDGKAGPVFGTVSKPSFWRSRRGRRSHGHPLRSRLRQGIAEVRRSH